MGALATYQYHLKDHLGNVRITFTTKDETEETLATLETTNENEERANFLKYDDIRKVNSTLFDHTNNGTTQYAMRLSGTPEETYGLARSIAVMPGDVISAEVFAKYVDLSQPDVTTALEDFIGAIVAGATAPGTIIDGGGYGSPAAATMPYGNLLNKTTEGPGAPKAYLNWIVFDKNFVPIATKSGFERITSIAMENGLLAPEGVLHEKLETYSSQTQSNEILIEEPGYVYIYLSNEEPGTEVYFDDFKVTHTKSPVIQSDDYYPFGLTFNSYSRENSLENRYLYNQGTGEITFKTERILDLELNVDQSKYRTYDYTTGRWWQVDPLADAGDLVELTPYNYSFNNPVRYNDPNGDCPPGDPNCPGRSSSSSGTGASLGSLLNSAVEAVGTIVNQLFGGSTGSPESGAEYGRALNTMSAVGAQTQEMKAELEGTVGQVPALGSALKVMDASRAETTGETMQHLAEGAWQANSIPASGAPKSGITKAYSRPNNATTVAQRESVQGQTCVDCGAPGKMVADHKTPLVVEYYETGTINMTKMRDVNSVQPQCTTCSSKQGALLRSFSMQMKERLGL